MKRAMVKEHEAERKTFRKSLQSEDKKGKLFRVVRQMLGRNKNVVGGGCVQNKNSKALFVKLGIRVMERTFSETTTVFLLIFFGIFFNTFL